jgi:nitrite reductase (NADH) small subunit
MTMMQNCTWVDVCSYDDLPSELGTRVLVGDAHVAVFRTHNGDVHAISSVDPFSGASVLARGIVGSRGNAAFVASPMYKQRFDLSTGICLEDPAVQVRVFPVEVAAGRVRVAGP